MLALGIGCWFALPTQAGWVALLLAGLAFACTGLAIGLRYRLGMALFVAGVMMSSGCGLVWARAKFMASPVLAKPVIAEVTGMIIRVEALAARDQLRLTINQSNKVLPPRLRVTLAQADAPKGLTVGQSLAFKARLMPPAEPAVPGGYDYARIAWFQGVGATGKILGRPKILSGTESLPDIRNHLSTHIAARVSPEAAGIAVSLATGNQGLVSQVDQDAMRTSGLAHLLSISGLHITAVVAAAMLLSLRLLALSPHLALRWNLPLISAGFGALAALGYTWLAGAEVPTIRSCIAAILVLFGLVLGREAITLRMVATGAVIVLILWPESLVGPSFQLSFAAITAIVALHEQPSIARFLQHRFESRVKRVARNLAGLLLTGLIVEIVLAPIALFHFHKSGLYGALANIAAIPFTTFVIMPLEALALAFDLVGLGGPFWWLTSLAISALLWLAHFIAALPGAVAMLPAISLAAYTMIIGGGLWVILWQGKGRWLGIAPYMFGAIFAFVADEPDILITNDGRHVAIRGDEGQMVILRPRAGDYIRNLLAERSGTTDMDDIASMRSARCSPDACTLTINRDNRQLTLLATRSSHFLPWPDMIAACTRADIVISDRMLPRGCKPRWFGADKSMLAKTGGLAIHLNENKIESVRKPDDDHPWRLAQVRGTTKPPSPSSSALVQ